MSLRKHFLLPVAATVIAVITTSASFAQMNEPGSGMMGMMGGGCPMMDMMGGGMMGKGMGGGRGMMGGGHMQMGAMSEGRLAYIKSALAITDSQTEAWNGYATVVRDHVAKMQEMRTGMMDMMEKGSALDRMNARAQGMHMMAGAMDAMKPALEKLYGVLTAEQKKTADDLLGMGCGAM